MAKMTLNVKGNDSHFQYQWWFKLKSVTSYRADKVKFTDRQVDGQTDGGNDNTPSAWNARR